MSKMKLNFKFEFPPIFGIYDIGDGTIYAFGDQGPDRIIDVLEHESLHFSVQEVAGKQASLDLDNMCSEHLRVEK